MRPKNLNLLSDNISADDLARKISLPDALHLVAMLCENISENNIKEYFKHVGFLFKLKLKKL